MRNISSARPESKPDTMVFAARVNHSNRPNGGRDSNHSFHPTSNPSRDPNRPFCIACKKNGHFFKLCYRVTGNFPEWWGDRPRDRIYINPNDTDLSNAVFVPDVEGRARWERLKKQGVGAGPKQGQNSGTAPNPGAAGHSSFAGTVNATASVSSFDKIDLNSMTPQQLEELNTMWQTRQATLKTDTISGKFSPLYWIIDTGASNHMSSSLSNFSNLKTIPPLSVGLRNGEVTIATQSGDIHLSSRLILRNVLYADNLHCHLISVSQLLLDTSLTIQFSHKFSLIQDRSSKTVIGAGEEYEGLYFLEGLRNLAAQINTVSTPDTVELWHRRLDHPASSISRFLPFISNKHLTSNFHSKHCDICLRSKQTQEPFSLSLSIASDIFDLIHCDLWRPYSENASCGSRFFLTIVDDFSRSTWFSHKHRIFLSAVTENHEPTSFKEAVQVAHWRDAMKSEIEALERNKTWTLETLPPNKKAIASKWVYKIKYNADGSIERDKARLVVMGNRQVEGIDYNETFAPTIKLVTVRTL
ncbi:uncharacterized protein LOC141618831 [Silene latifolia]|uniref:uncharacterized protein LOC141618831 n=1 Tax=Silene latifolia TaxID=37657 RepID=UPI003D76EFE8